MQPKYYLGYVSANETNFLQDFVNIYLMTKHKPGVSKINLYLIFSEVNKPTKYQERALRFLSYLVSRCNWLDLKQVLLKPNTGRDFSSANVFLSTIRAEASSNDIIMIRNRSSHGPFMDDWYSDYAALLSSKENIGLVGNTINFYNLNREALNTTHVQTYVYVSLWHILSQFVNNFPGSDENEKNEVIHKGEIGLSQQIMEKGFAITCLEWPSKYFDLKKQVENNDPRKDFKSKVKRLPFLHRENQGQRFRKFTLKSYLVILFAIFNCSKALKK